MKRVLVTGGTGVTGVALVRFLLEKGIEVIAIVRPGSFREKYLPIGDVRLQIVYGKLQELSTLGERIKEFGQIDAFFHLAWEGSTIADKQGSRDNMQLQSRNIVYAVDAAELCHEINCPVFVMTGSQAEYGIHDEKITEDTPSLPVNGYGNAKLCAENMTRIMCRKYGIRHVFARLFSIYGPYDGTNSLVNTSVLKLLNGERPQYSEGKQIWNYLYSFDAAKALWMLGEKGVDGEVYNVGNEEERPLCDYIKIIHEAVNPDIPPVLGEVPYTDGKYVEMRCDSSKIQKLGFKSDYSFCDGIETIKNWSIKTREEYIGNRENMEFYKND